MLPKDFLSDDFEMNGRKVSDLKDVLREMDSATSLLTYPMKSISFLTPLNKDKQTRDDRYYVYLFSPQEPQKDGRYKRYAVLREKFKDKNFSKQLMEKSVEEGQFMFYVAGSYVFASKWIYKTLAAKVGAQTSFLEENCPERDAYLAKLFDRDEEVTLVCRAYNGTGKAFAILSPHFTLNRLSLITETCDELKKEHPDMTCLEWHVDHKKARAVFEFPDLEQAMSEKYGLEDIWTPCLEFSMSNIGQGSFIARGRWLINDTSFVFDSAAYTRENRGAFPDAEEMAKNVEHEVIERFENLASTLSALSYDVIKPKDVKSVKGKNKKTDEKEDEEKDFPWTFKENHEAVSEAFKKVYVHSQLKTAIGKERLKEFADYNEARIDDTKTYTAYDIVRDVMTSLDDFRDFADTSEGCAFAGHTYEKFMAATSEMPYTDFDKEKRRGKKKKEVA